MRTKDFAALVTLAALWGASFLLIRIAVPAFGPFSLMAGRVVVSALLLWIGLRVTGRRPSGLRANARHLLVLGAVNAALPFTLVAASELQLPASVAAVLIATSPLFSALLSARAGTERIDRRRGAGLLLGVMGVGALVGWSPMALTATTVLSIVATLVAAASYAYAGEYTARHLASMSSPTIAFGQQLGAAAWLVIPAMAQPPAMGTAIPASAMWALVGLAAFCTSAAYLIYFYLIGTIGPVRTNSVTYLIPPFGILWGTLFLGESMTPQMLVGLGLILGSVVLMNAARVENGDDLRLTEEHRPAARVPVMLAVADARVGAGGE
jgi:drug/metabolite transporter (DMT)-like permease